jgi:hypothetical protein
MYSEEKLERFHKCILDDYNTSLVIEKIANVGVVDKTDGDFTQIAIRPSLDEDIFTAPNYAPELLGAGRVIAIGERNFLIKTLLSDTEIKTIKINKEDFSPKRLSDELGTLKASIFVPTTIKSNMLKNRIWLNHIDFRENAKFNYFYDLFSVPDSVLDNKILIIDKEAIFWKKQGFENHISKKIEKLDISIGSSRHGKADVLIRSVNQFAYYKEWIRIIHLTERV